MRALGHKKAVKLRLQRRYRELAAPDAVMLY
jgi:hypothetical protein